MDDKMIETYGTLNCLDSENEMEKNGHAPAPNDIGQP